jgi:hypothetical protein
MSTYGFKYNIKSRKDLEKITRKNILFEIIKNKSNLLNLIGSKTSVSTLSFFKYKITPRASLKILVLILACEVFCNPVSEESIISKVLVSKIPSLINIYYITNIKDI